jgi:hypothetical protein
MQISQLPELEQSRPGGRQAKLCSLEGSDPSGWCLVFLRTGKGAPVSFSCSQFPLLMIDSPLQRLFTDADMYNADLREEIEDFYLYLDIENLTLPSKDYDLVLDIMPTMDQRIQWSYYFACHKARCLFWLDKYDASSEICGVESPAHMSASPSFTILPLYPLIQVQSIIWRIYTGTSPVFL